MASGRWYDPVVVGGPTGSYAGRVGISNRLHVVVFTDTFFETNGIGSYYRTLLEWSRRTGDFDLTVLCPARNDLQNGNGTAGVVAVRPALSGRNPFYRDLTIGCFSASKLRDLIRRLPGRRVLHVATSGPLGAAATAVARQLGIPIVGCYHTDLNRCARLYGASILGQPGAWVGARIASLCDRLAYGRCQAVCVPSASAEATVKAFYAGPTTVIPNPVDVNRFRPSPTRAGRFRAKYCDNGRVLTVVVGRVAKEKNLDLVCELLASDERLQLVFVGDGPHAATLLHRWGARVTGFLNGKELLEAYQQADLFVQLSVNETFGMSLVEALACGLPAIVLRSQGLAATIPPGCGVDVVEQHELPSLADRCVSLVSDRTRYGESARAVREFVLTLASDAILPKFIQFHAAHAQ